MGWLFGWHTRKELADHLLTGNGIVTLKHCFKGNNLWAVQEGVRQDGVTVRFIALYLLRGNTKARDKWGYKDIDESMGPYAHNCPVSYIDFVEAHEKAFGYEPAGYAREWRANVREYAAKAGRKLLPGTKVRLYGVEYTITGRPFGHGKDYSVINEHGEHLRMRQRYVKHVEVLP